MGVAPLVITGMHRSGTSATARLLQAGGLDVGADLLGPSLDNRLGYYEDREFGALNLDLVAAGVGDPSAAPDWAFPERLAPERLLPLRARAAALIDARSARGHPWGWKDPRTSLLLDFYDELVPDARYLFVYRSPWDVLHSLMGTQERPFHGRADLAVRVWTAYNERLLAFRDRHPGRTGLVHVDAVAEQPAAVLELAGVCAPEGDPGRSLDGALAAAFAPGLLRRDDPSGALAELVAADHPEAMAVYARLELAADHPAAAEHPAAGPPAAGHANAHDRPGRGPVEVHVETLRGLVDVAVALVGAPADGVEEATRVARPVDITEPARAADAAITRLEDDLVAVLFAGQLRPAALRMAAQALIGDPDLGAVLLTPGGQPQPAVEHDPVAAARAGAGVVVRRAAWLATRGFAACAVPEGYEGWAFAVACVSAGRRVALVEGALHLPDPGGDDALARRTVLQAHPALTARWALAAEDERAAAERSAEQARWEAARARDREQAAGVREQAASVREQAAGELAHAAAEQIRAEAEHARGQAEQARAAIQEAELARERAAAAAEAALVSVQRAHAADQRAQDSAVSAMNAADRAATAEARALAAEADRNAMAEQLAQLQTTRLVRYADRLSRLRSR